MDHVAIMEKSWGLIPKGFLRVYELLLLRIFL